MGFPMSSTRVDHEKVYKAVPLFQSLSESELNDILAISRLFRSPAGHHLVEQGESGKGVFILVNGSASVTVTDDDGESTTLAVLGRGDTVGELSLIDSSPHSATVTCAETCTVFHVDTKAFNGLRAQHNPAAFKVLRATAPMICERLRQINERIATIFANPQKSMSEMEKVYLRKADQNPFQ
jgi:CRP/FNR family cyclic AMP-dependent transcriptional regulator